MKRFGILVVFLLALSLFSYSAFATGVLDAHSKLSMSVEPGESGQVSFDIKNTGNETLTNVKLDLSSIDTIDSDDNEITLSYDIDGSTTKDLGVGQSAIVTIYADVDSSYELGDQTKTITLTANGVSNLGVKFTLEVRPLVCVSGQAGDLKIEIKDPDSGQEYEVGETVTPTVNVENNGDDDKYIIVEASLYDLDNGKKISSYKSSKKKVSDGNDYDFEFNLKISDSFDVDHELMMYAKAYESSEEETQCIEDKQDISVIQPEDKVSISSFTLSPSSVQCGGSVDGIVSLLNLGSNDEAVTVTLQASSLNGVTTSASARLGTDTDDDSEVVTSTLRIPSNAKEGQYTVIATAIYSGERETSEQMLNVYCPQATTAVSAVTTQTATSNNVVPSTTTYTQKGAFDYFDTSDGIPMSVWILVDVLLVAGIVALLVVIFRKRH